MAWSNNVAALRALTGLVVLALSACAPLPTRIEDERMAARVPTEHRPSPNYDRRRPNYVVLHHTTNSTADQALRTLTTPSRRVSAHYLVGRDGRIYHLVDERERAWHAGESYWGGQRDLNSASIGIELDNTGDEPYAEPMIQSLLALLADLKTRYRLPPASFLAHGDIAPGRKVDPSALFPWQRLAAQGFGLWCDAPYPAVPADVDTALLLQTFGYNVWDLNAAIAAFKRRYVPNDPAPTMTERDRSVLYCLVQQMQAAP